MPHGSPKSPRQKRDVKGTADTVPWPWARWSVATLGQGAMKDIHGFKDHQGLLNMSKHRLHRCPKFPLVGWFMTRFVLPPITIGNWWCRWYTSHRPKPISTKRTLLCPSPCWVHSGDSWGSVKMPEVEGCFMLFHFTRLMAIGCFSGTTTPLGWIRGMNGASQAFLPKAKKNMDNAVTTKKYLA